MKYYGYKAIKNNKVIFIEWFCDEKDRDEIVSILRNAFSINDDKERANLLNEYKHYYKPIINEKNLSFEETTTEVELWSFLQDITDNYYVDCKGKLMQSVAREVNSLIVEGVNHQIHIFNDLENETIDKRDNIDCWSLSDVYVAYLNMEYCYNFIRTTPIKSLIRIKNYYPCESPESFDSKYYTDIEKKVTLCFSKHSKEFVWFRQLHETIIRSIVEFCKRHNLKDIDAFQMSADGLKSSIEYGRWHPCTDSAFNLINSDGKQVMLSI